MPDIKIESLYNELKPKLETLETERLTVLKKIATLVKVIILICLFLAIPVVYFTEAMWVVAIGIAGVVAYLIGRVKLQKKYRMDYKANILEVMVSTLGTNYSYDPNGKIDKELMQTSKLFKKFNKIDCEDLIEGKFEKYSFRQAEISLDYHIEGTNQGGSTKNIFRGLFFVGTLPISFPANIWVYPKVQVDKSAHDKVQVVETNNKNFSDVFIAYSDVDQPTASLLPTSMLDNMVDIYQKFQGERMKFAFIENNVIVAIHSDKDLFEPSMKIPVTDFETFKADFRYLKLTTSLVNQLLESN